MGILDFFQFRSRIYASGFHFGKRYGNYSILTNIIKKRRQNAIKPRVSYKLLTTFFATHPLFSIFLYKDNDFSKRIGSTFYYIRIMILFILAAIIHQVEVLMNWMVYELTSSSF